MNKKRVVLVCSVLVILTFFTVGIFTIKAQEQQQPDEQELQLINKLIVEDLKIRGLVDEIGVDLMFRGNDGSKSHPSDVDNGIDGAMVAIQRALQWKVDEQVPLSDDLFNLKSELEILSDLTDTNSALDVHISEMANTIASLENLLFSQKSKKSTRINPTIKTALYKTLANNQERILTKPQQFTDNDIGNQLPRIGGLRYSNDKLKATRQYLSLTSEFLDENQGICRLNQNRADDCFAILAIIKTILPQIDDVTRKLEQNIGRIQSLTDMFNELPPRYVSELEGDLNGDNQVNIFDLVIVARNFGKKLVQ